MRFESLGREIPRIFEHINTIKSNLNCLFVNGLSAPLKNLFMAICFTFSYSIGSTTKFLVNLAMKLALGFL